MKQGHILSRMQRIIAFVAFAVIQSYPVYAFEEHDKFWLGVNYENSFNNNKQWHYLLNTQWHFIDKSHPWQTTFLEGGIGYLLAQDKRVWLGYRWTGDNPNNGFYQENRLWQQLLWTLNDKQQNIISSRTRLEEIERTNQSQISSRLRQRFMFEYSGLHLHHWTPVIYDEGFFQLKTTNYSSHAFFSQNWLFVGVHLKTSPSAFWEIGYINQYLFNSPSKHEDAVNHILWMTYNISPTALA